MSDTSAAQDARDNAIANFFKALTNILISAQPLVDSAVDELEQKRKVERRVK
jgi:hypothetical protein